MTNAFELLTSATIHLNGSSPKETEVTPQHIRYATDPITQELVTIQPAYEVQVYHPKERTPTICPARINQSGSAIARSHLGGREIQCCPRDCPAFKSLLQTLADYNIARYAVSCICDP
jgi:hypothetical protein